MTDQKGLATRQEWPSTLLPQDIKANEVGLGPQRPREKRRDMAITEGIEPTRRETIDQLLQGAVEQARVNDQEMLRLRSLLLGAPKDEQRPDRPLRPGWFGEIQDGLEVLRECLENTAKALQEVQMQVSTQVPTPKTTSRV